MKIASAPLSISFGIHLLLIATSIVLNSMFISGEKLVTIDLTVEDSVNRASVCPDKGAGPEIKNKGSAMKKAFYPKIAVRMEWEGKVEVSFIILSDGGVKGIKVVKSSGREILDKSAMEAVKLASPFPRPSATVELKAPVSYKLL